MTFTPAQIGSGSATLSVSDSAFDRPQTASLTGTGTVVELNPTSLNFRTPTDAVWLARGAIKTGSMGPDKTIDAIRDYIAAFLDRYLMGKPATGLLLEPSAYYPDAEVITQRRSLRTAP